MDAPIERRRETKQREHPDLEAQQCLLGRRTLIERRQKSHGRIEHGGLGLVVRDPLADQGHACTRRPDRPQAPKNLMKRLIDRHALQVRELASAGSEIRIHQDVRLQRATKATLAFSRTTRERGDLAVALG
jgi:hypothetical protein